MTTDFNTNKAAFLERLAEIIPEDANYFQFDVAFNSRDRLASVTTGQYPSGLRIDRLEREVITIDGKHARYTIGGQL